MHAAKRVKTRPSPFPLSLCTYRMHISLPLPLSHALQLMLNRTLEHSATIPAKADTYMVSLAGASHLAELVTSLTNPMYP